MKRYTPQHIVCAVLCALLAACASIGNPSGGARDEDPPRFISASPAPGAVNVDSTNVDISLTFNELINVKNAFENVVLSPPGKSVPRVSTRGRRILVNSTDTLLPNTTYTIDFGDAIEDNNEGNILSGFAYTFSTGPVLDSLRISGMVLGAEDMEPQQGVFVGAYTSREDSAFLRTPFERLARTDEMGRFVLRGLRDTTYRLFALKDLDNDRHYANPEEDIAWYADTIRPYAERILAQDTIRDLYTGAVDTVIERNRTRFLPNNVLLRMFNTGVKPQYLVAYTRPDSTKLSFIFNSPEKVRPKVKLVDDADYPDPLLAESSVGNDSLTFFLPVALAMRDTLHLAIEYVRTDVASGVPSIVNDTVKLMKPKVQKPKEKKKKKSKKKEKKQEAADDAAETSGNDAGEDAAAAGEKPEAEAKPEDAKDDEEPEKEVIPPFKISATGPEKDISLPVLLEVPVPLARLDSTAFLLEMNPDSVWRKVPRPYRLEKADTLSERRFKIEYPWERGMTYRLQVDSLAATDIYGLQSDKLQYEFKTKPEEEVANLKMTLTGLDPEIPAFVQLLAGGDKVSYTAPVVNGVAEFKGIDGGKYYARVYEDFNGDGRYTPGTYRLQRLYRMPESAPDSVAHSVADSVANAAAPAGNPAAGDVAPDAENNTVETGSEEASGEAGSDAKEKAGSDAKEEAGSDEKEDSSDAKEADSDTEETDSNTEEAGGNVAKRRDTLIPEGYSITPLENDTVGIELLIAVQPDLVYYYPKQINVKKAWDVDQSWNVFETALDLQKPAKIKKNKPKRKNQQTQQEEEEEEDEDDFFGNPFNPNDRNNRNRNPFNGQGNFRTNR